MSSLPSKRISVRLLLAFAVTPLIMIALTVIGISLVNSIEQSLITINDVNAVKQRYAINFRGSVHDRAISLRDVVLYREAANIDASIAEIRQLARFYEESAGPLDKIFSDQSSRGEDYNLLLKIKEIEQTTLPLLEKTIQAKKSGQEAEAWKLLMVEAKPAFTAWLASINKFIDYQERLNGEAAKSARSTASGFQYLMTVLTLVSLIVTGLMSFLISRSIVQQMKQVATEIDRSSLLISKVSQGISVSSESLAKGSDDQTKAIDSIGSSMDQIHGMVQKTAQNARNAAKAAADSKQSAENGERVVNQMVNAISAIDAGTKNIMVQVDEGNRKISEIVGIISEIHDKTQVINDIVFQTKLLSFNAAVEAARAGDSGRGFAVVAEEVGNLAQMSGKSAKEIAVLLDTSRSKVEAIIQETKSKVSTLIADAGNKVDVGNTIARQCSEVLLDIVNKVHEVTRMADEISVAATEQSHGLAVMTGNISDMDKVTQSNTRMSVQIAETSKVLNQQARELRQSFAQLNAMIQSSEKTARQLQRAERPEMRLVKDESEAEGLPEASDFKESA